LLHLFGTGGFLLRTLGHTALYLYRRKVVYKELRDQWWACTKAGWGHLWDK
jgi:hypothetical protein